MDNGNKEKAKVVFAIGGKGYPSGKKVVLTKDKVKGILALGGKKKK